MTGLPPDLMLSVVTQAHEATARDVGDPVLLEVTEGAIPKDLAGTLLRNGPGRHERGGVRYGHPFDGDGYVQRLTFADGRATWSGRFVKTREYVAEEAAGRILYRGFGTNKPGGLWTNALRMRFKNAANTSVVHHAGHTLALWEGGLPHAIDPGTLETLGRFHYDGALLNDFSIVDRWLNPELPFSAHPSVDLHTGELWNFGTAYGLENRLLVHRVDAEGVLTTRSFSLEGLPFVHDMALTKRFAVLVLPAVSFDIPSALLGLKTPVNSLSLEDAPGTAFLVPRDGGEPLQFEVSPGFVFHWAASWEDGDRVVLEGVKYDGFPAFDDFEALFAEEGLPNVLAHLTRIEIELTSGRVTETRLGDHPMELPTSVGAGAQRTIFGIAAPPSRVQPFLSGLIRHRPDGGTHFRDYFPHLMGEPLPAGDWLLVPVWRQEGHAEVWVVDHDLEVACRLHLPVDVPPPLHGTWLPAD